MERPETASRRAFSRQPGPKITGETLIVGSALAAACALAWWWLAQMGGGGMEMATMAPRPAVWSAAYLEPAFAMWAVMMVAMMLPSAAPMILLFARIPRKDSRAFHLMLFAGSYLAVWTLFSVVAALAQALLVAVGLVSQATRSEEHTSELQSRQY